VVFFSLPTIGILHFVQYSVKILTLSLCLTVTYIVCKKVGIYCNFRPYFNNFTVLSPHITHCLTDTGTNKPGNHCYHLLLFPNVLDCNFTDIWSVLLINGVSIYNAISTLSSRIAMLGSQFLILFLFPTILRMELVFGLLWHEGRPTIWRVLGGIKSRFTF
jgi:hypothetical protein